MSSSLRRLEVNRKKKKKKEDHDRHSSDYVIRTTTMPPAAGTKGAAAAGAALGTDISEAATYSPPPLSSLAHQYECCLYFVCGHIYPKLSIIKCYVKRFLGPWARIY